MKILFITPHLSTGGGPQYLLKKIKELVDGHDIYCVEYSNVTGGVLVVQRNQIEQILGDKLITLNENKLDLINHIKDINPDIIHFEELPEYFCDKSVVRKIYSIDRSYKIIETSHDSSFDITTKMFYPDHFIFVSEYQKQLFSSLNIPSDVVEYPIIYKTRSKNRDDLLRSVGLDPKLKHIVNVGLFTSRKNQAEIIEYAKMLKDYPVQFHFIGNQADNFKWYWEPLMRDFPSNCKWWGERKDVDTFYELADLFLFTSKGNSSDKETMPLVIRESIGWNLPSLIYNLPVYLNYFDKYENIKYLEDDKNQNIKKILNCLFGTISQIEPIPTFTSRWDLENQLIYYSTETQINYPLLVSLKEYRSDAVLWSTVMDSMSPYIEFWLCPISKSTFCYKSDPHFMGVKLCIYNNKTGEQIYEQPYVDKFVNIPQISLSNFIPYRYNYLEYFVHKKYKKWLDKSYDLVVDVGANVGVFTSYMLHNDYAKKIVMIECDKKALTDLKKNFKNNTNVFLIEKALSDSEESVYFYHSEENPVISSTIHPDKLVAHMAGVKGTEKTLVDTITLKQLIDKYGNIDLLKIDIEGGEYNVIINSDNNIYENINNMFVECHFFENDYVEMYNKMVDKLKSVGYIVDEYMTNQHQNVGTSECIFAHKK